MYPNVTVIVNIEPLVLMIGRAREFPVHMQYFRTAQLYLKNIINKFHIFAISEHSLFTKQLDLLKQCTDYRYNCTAVCSDDNPPILSGKRGRHGGVAIFWDLSYNDYVEPFSGIDCDCIIGIKCNFPNLLSFFVLAVYLPSSNHHDEDFSEYLDLLWSLYDSLSTEGLVVVMGDLNANMGNAIGDKSAHKPSYHGEKLLEFAHYFNLSPVNLFQNCTGPLDTFFQPVVVSIQPLTTFSYQIAGLKRLLMQKRFAYLLIILLIMYLFK